MPVVGVPRVHYTTEFLQPWCRIYNAPIRGERCKCKQPTWPSRVSASARLMLRWGSFMSECGTWSHEVMSSLGARARGGVGQAPGFRVARCQTSSGVGPKTGRKLSKIIQKLSTSAKVNMLKSGDVNFEFGFEWCRPTQLQSLYPKFWSGPILADQCSGPVQKHQIGSEMGRESTVWPETKTK